MGGVRGSPFPGLCGTLTARVCQLLPLHSVLTPAWPPGLVSRGGLQRSPSFLSPLPRPPLELWPAPRTRHPRGPACVPSSGLADQPLPEEDAPLL